MWNTSWANHSGILRSSKNVPEQTNPASSEWAQLWTPIPLLVQSNKFVSVPVHPTLSRRMSPVPCPNVALIGALVAVRGSSSHGMSYHTTQIESLYIPVPYPSCAHTTFPSFKSQLSSQTVPQALLLHTSTRPSYIVLPPTRRISLWVQTVELVSACVIMTNNSIHSHKWATTHLPWQITPTSSLWAQLWLLRPPWLQLNREVSVPVQARSSSTMLPVPCP